MFTWKKGYRILSAILICVFLLSGCNSPYGGGSSAPEEIQTQPTVSGQEYDEAGLIISSFSEPMKLDDNVTVTVNSAEIFSSFEETGYTADDEAVIEDRNFDSDCVFIAIDYTLLYTDENLKGQIVKKNDNSLAINGMFDLYSSKTGTQSDNTEERVWTRFPDSEIVLDYTMVEGGERYTDNYRTYFDVIEGQEFNFKIVYAVRKDLLIGSSFYLAVSKVYSSIYQTYNIDLHLSVEDL